jgi:molybdopterin converting factor small subunit
MATSKSPTGKFTLLYFAAASTLTTKTSETFPAPMTLFSLFSMLEEKYPGIKEKVLGHSAVTVNLEYVDLEDQSVEGEGRGMETVVKEGDEVAIIPPVSSG